MFLNDRILNSTPFWNRPLTQEPSKTHDVSKSGRFFLIVWLKLLARTSSEHIEKHSVYWRQLHLLLLHSSPLEQRLWRRRWCRHNPWLVRAIRAEWCIEYTGWTSGLHPFLAWNVVKHQLAAFIYFLLFKIKYQWNQLLILITKLHWHLLSNNNTYRINFE